MQSNDLFRLVSLRKSKPSDSEGETPSAPSDPRLRHRDRIAGQSHVETSDPAKRLDSLKARHGELRRAVRDLEAVQRVVVKTAMLGEQREPPAPASHTAGAAST